jgi:hypothetical protein
MAPPRLLFHQSFSPFALSQCLISFSKASSVYLKLIPLLMAENFFNKKKRANTRQCLVVVSSSRNSPCSNHKTSLHATSKWLKDGTIASPVASILMEKWRFWFGKVVTTLLETILGNFVINHQPLLQPQHITTYNIKVAQGWYHCQPCSIDIDGEMAFLV